jgi:hypothetical protein
VYLDPADKGIFKYRNKVDLDVTTTRHWWDDNFFHYGTECRTNSLDDS